MSKPISNISNKQFHKSNYSEALKYIIPDMYYEQDYSLKNSEIDIVDQVINSHLRVIGNVSSILPVSAIPGSTYSDIDTPEGISKFFVKQNGLTDIDLSDFERKILVPLDKSYSDFETSADFSTYVSQTLLPGIRINEPTLDFLDGGTPADNHEYLITNLSWLYFLNMSGTSLAYNPSAFVHDTLVNKIYIGESIQTVDGMQGLSKYLWYNFSANPSWRSWGVIPNDFRPPAYTVNDAYTSGTQQLDKLLTLMEIVYSPLYIDNSDTRVRDAIDDYLQNGYEIEQEILNGPFLKLVKAFSFAFADYSNEVDRLEIISDIDRCPDNLLPYLADLIGWKLFGAEPDRWRLQLVNAVDIYRSAGTKRSLQLIVDSVFGQDVFDVSSRVEELWESYIPYLIEYALATESELLRDFNSWTPELSLSLGIPLNNRSDMAINVRYCVDAILYDLVLKYRTSFLFDGKPFPLGSPDFIFNYRDRDFPIPPYEEIPYYRNVRVTYDMVDTIVDKLVCFGVRQEFAFQVGDFIKANVFEVSEDFLTTNNGWVFFTSGVNYPPNWDALLLDVTNTKTQYLPMWNGKSSHFKLVFDASGFDFNKTSLEADSSETLLTAARVSKDYSPAHSIPMVIASVSEQDDYAVALGAFNAIRFDQTDSAAIGLSISAGLSRYGASAFYQPTYKRGIASSLASFGRLDANNIADGILSPTGTLTSLPRRTHRRRDFKNIIPKDGFYDRTGFNMPISYEPYISNTDEFMPLGFIPSSLSFVPITDYHNIPAVYDICENLNSSSVYNGVATSATYPVRGWK